MLSVDKFLPDGTQLTSGFYTNADYKFTNSGETVSYSNKRNCVEFVTGFGNIGLKVSEYEPTDNYSAWVTYYTSGNRNKERVYAEEKKKYFHEKTYEQLVSEYIRKKCSLDAELAILRQKDEKPEEYAAYYAYAEECKKKARSECE